MPTQLRSIAELEAQRALCLKARVAAKPCLSVCTGSGCSATGAHDVIEALRKALERAGLQDAVDVKSTGCHGFCEKGPLTLVWPEGVFYNRVAARDAKDIIASLSNGRRPVERLLYQDPTTGARILREDEVPFYAHQQRILFGNNGKIDPRSIEDYLSVGGRSEERRVGK